MRLLLFLMYTIFVGCTFQTFDLESDKQEGLQTIRKFYRSADSADYGAIDHLIHDEYRTGLDTSAIRKLLNSMTLKYGKVQYRDLNAWRTYSTSDNGNVTEFQFLYRVRRDSSFTLEKFELLEHDDTAKITLFEFSALLPLENSL